VELALTISGIKKEERKQRAMEALKTVGLEGMEKKKPNQLSGGQMQRVAIARALVNNPEILLADEPTGALDSETSVQIMDLLKEVASDRLVIMVTHNPDLAYQYANRIVTMKDGLITGDNNPYEGENKEQLKVALDKKTVNKGNKSKTSMSFFTATGLSFFNLLSKIKRTVLITIAGSIGIIGVSAVLAVRQGVTNYVDGMQDDMLSRYPLQIAETAVDYSSLMSGLATMDQKELSQFDLTTEVGLDSMIQYLMAKYNDFTKVKTNDINDDLISFIEGMPDKDKYISAIFKDYGLDLTNNIFTKWQRDESSEERYMSLNGLTQMYISELKKRTNSSPKEIETFRKVWRRVKVD
jgi:putative ABC transport system permease protein